MVRVTSSAVTTHALAQWSSAGLERARRRAAACRHRRWTVKTRAAARDADGVHRHALRRQTRVPARAHSTRGLAQVGVALAEPRLELLLMRPPIAKDVE